MDNLSAIPQNELLGLVASALRKGKDVLNYPGKLPESVPLLGGMGAGDVLFGKGPELMEDMSYGSPPYKGSGWATKVDPRTVDLAFAPGVGTLASTTLRGGKAVATAVPQIATNMSRREFLKKAGALTAGGAAAAMTPGIVSKVLREGAPAVLKEAAPLVAKEATPAAAAQVVKNLWTPELIDQAVLKLAKFHSGEGRIEKLAHPEVLRATVPNYWGNPEEFLNTAKFMDAWKEPVAGQSFKQLTDFDAALAAHPKYDKTGTIGYPYYGLDEKEYKNLYKQFSRSKSEIAKDRAPRKLLNKLSQQELDQIVRSGIIPQELADAGVTPGMVSYARWPVDMSSQWSGSRGIDEEILSTVSKAVYGK